MREAKHDESKSESQLERLVFFTDGVFAIAITLLVMEIKIPELIFNGTDAKLLKYIEDMSFKFLGFLISFGIIGHYWSVHHRIFGYVKKSTNNLIWVNFVYLLSIVILPFSSGLVGEYSIYLDMNVPYTIYVANMCFTGFANCFLWLYLSNPKRDLLTRKIPKARIHLGLFRSIIIPVVFIISLIVSFSYPIAGRFIPLLIPLALHFGMKGLERRADLHDLVKHRVHTEHGHTHE